MKCVLGRHGFIGGGLFKKLSETESVVGYPTADCDTIYDFGSPTHQPFEYNIDYNADQILQRTAWLMRFCRENQIKLVYPSSALVYEKDTPFAVLKKITEEMQKVYRCDALALRIFPVYGVGEHRTAIYQWCKAVKNGEEPVVYGDGSQKRNFVYVDDVIDNIISMGKEFSGIKDIASSEVKTFNEIVEIVKKVAGVKVKTKFVPSPTGYSEGVFSLEPVKERVSLADGIKRLYDSL